jgi:hypothetical protein
VCPDLDVVDAERADRALLLQVSLARRVATISVTCAFTGWACGPSAVTAARTTPRSGAVLVVA